MNGFLCCESPEDGARCRDNCPELAIERPIIDPAVAFFGKESVVELI